MKLTSKVNALLGKNKKSDDATFGESLKLEQIAVIDDNASSEDSFNAAKSETPSKTTRSFIKHPSVLDLDFMAAPLAEIETMQPQPLKGEQDLNLSTADQKTIYRSQIDDNKKIAQANLSPAPIVAKYEQTQTPCPSTSDIALAQTLRNSDASSYLLFYPDGQLLEKTANFNVITGVSTKEQDSIIDYISAMKVLSKANLPHQDIEIILQEKSAEMRKRAARGEYKSYQSIKTMNGKTLEISDIYTENNHLIILIRDASNQTGKSSSHDKEMNELKELSQNKSDFLARISHEIRTPLNAIVGMTDALRDEVTNEEARQTASFIADAAENLDNILNQTLEQERLSTSTIILEEQAVNINDLVQSTAKLWGKSCADKGLELNVRISPDLPERVALDSSRFRQCLTNILSNAVKFTNSGNVMVAVAPMNLESVHPKILVAVRDTGIGISDEALENVFKPYRQGDATIQRRFGGSGLGMSITKHIVDAMNGHIKINSVEGAGSTVAITLPLKRPDADTLATHSNQETIAVKSENIPAETFHKHISNIQDGPTKVANDTEVRKNVAIVPSDYSGFDVLIVEDNPINQAVVKKLLTNHIHSMEFAFHGEEALELLETKTFDVILMDIHMPVKDGIETTLEIRNSGKAWADTVIVALTADPDYQQKRVCRNIGMNDALSKPVKRQELLDVMQRVLMDRISMTNKQLTA